ncbi:MAG TPA: hypothetical protein VM598_06345 [Bdellovibrionota bacterium]|nr:hypothetical protein [Bdellovibrionota bacterium]
MNMSFLGGALALAFFVLGTSPAHAFAPPKPVYPTPDPNCLVDSVTRLPSSYDILATAPGSQTAFFNTRDANDLYQLHRLNPDGTSQCLTCVQVAGGPRVDRHKVMVTQHPSGKFVFVGVEQDIHEWDYIMPADWEIGLIQSGIWIDMWVTTPNGDRWWRLTDFWASKEATGYTGIAFTSDGKVAAWSEAQPAANMFANTYGEWKLFRAEFVVDSMGNPGFINKRDISPPDARWLETGNFHPDNRRVLLSTDIGMGNPRNAEGQDQWSLDIYTGQLVQLMNTPQIWDEHGVYSPDGKKIVFMSSHPYSLSNPNGWHVVSLKTEFLIMNSDGTGLQPITHFNEPGYPEFRPEGGVAAVAYWRDDGSLFATVLEAGFRMTNWKIRFKGRCGF